MLMYLLLYVFLAYEICLLTTVLDVLSYASPHNSLKGQPFGLHPTHDSRAAWAPHVPRVPRQSGR